VGSPGIGCASERTVLAAVGVGALIGGIIVVASNHTTVTQRREPRVARADDRWLRLPERARETAGDGPLPKMQGVSLFHTTF
jgi:hypothetical protein